MVKITLFMPVRDEIEGAKIIMPRINKNWVDEILVVDGNSTDGTYEFFEQYGCKMIHQKSVGICGATWEGIEAATGDIIIGFSPDNNSIPELIPPLIEKMREGYDMVIISRYMAGAKSDDDDLVTAFGNWMFTRIINLLFRAKYTDTLVMYRAFKKDLPVRLGMDQKKYPFFEPQMAIRCATHKVKYTEIPGDEPKRIGGVRKMRPLYTGAAISLMILKEFFLRHQPGH